MIGKGLSVRNHPTIIDVARLAGVSKSTVSRVLQGNQASVSVEARRSVLHAIQALGYEHNAVARNLRTARTNLIMLILPDIANPFWPGVARGLQDVMEKAGYSVVFANSDWDAQHETMFLNTARRNRFAAIAINPTAVSAAALRTVGVPTVILGLRDGYPDFDMVGSDTFGGVLEALTHLYELGHRRIGFIQGHHQSGRGQARARGYQVFLRSHNLPVDETLIATASYDLAGGRQAAQILLHLPDRPTAIFASNDILAMGAMQVAHTVGLRVPDDLSIVGMDDIYPAAMTAPALTTMAKDKYATGRQAAHFLLERLEGKAPAEARRHIVPCTLVVRGSTGVLGDTVTGRQGDGVMG